MNKDCKKDCKKEKMIRLQNKPCKHTISQEMVVLIIIEARKEDGDSKTHEVEEVTPKIKVNLNLIKEVEITAVKEVVVLVLVEEEAKRNGIKEMLNASIVEKEVTMQKNVGIRRKMLMMKHN